MKSLPKIFLLIAGVLLLITGIAKLVSSLGTAKILQAPDPVLGLKLQYVFWIVSALEFAIALVCFFCKRIKTSAGLLLWVATVFLTYRFALHSGNYDKPCGCLGSITSVLHMSEKTADTIALAILGYFLLAGASVLIWSWKREKLTTNAESISLRSP